jgi:hypothetical protein
MENHFEINGSSRFIKETSETKLVVVQGDHKSEVLTFKMPRYIDGHDMTLCNKIRIHYINLDTKTNNKSADVYEVTDLTLCEECEDVLTFTWTIEAPATKYSGTLSFLVKFECTEGENVLYQWNTAKYVSVNVLAGIDNSEEFVEKYSNVLEEWYNELTKGADSIEELNQQAIAEIELAKEDAKENIEKRTSAKMKEIDEYSESVKEDVFNDIDTKKEETLEEIDDEFLKWVAEHSELIGKDYVTPQMFGASVTLDDNSEAFNDCINYALENKLYIYIPSGEYKFTTGITLKNVMALKIIGANNANSKRGTKLTYIGTESMFTLDGCSHVSISDVNITASNGKAITLSGERNHYCNFEKIHIMDSVYGIYITSSTGYTYFTKVNISVTENTERAIFIDTDTTNNTVWANYIYFVQCSCDALSLGENEKTLVEIGTCYYIFFDKCDLCNAGIGILSTKNNSHIKCVMTEFFKLNTGVYYDKTITNVFKHDLFESCGFKCDKGLIASEDLEYPIQHISVTGCDFSCESDLLAGSFYLIAFSGNVYNPKPNGKTLVNKIRYTDGICVNRVYFSLEAGETKEYNIDNSQNLFTSYSAITNKPRTVDVVVRNVTDSKVTLSLTNLSEYSQSGYAMIY